MIVSSVIDSDAPFALSGSVNTGTKPGTATFLLIIFSKRFTSSLSSSSSSSSEDVVRSSSLSAAGAGTARCTLAKIVAALSCFTLFFIGA